MSVLQDVAWGESLLEPRRDPDLERQAREAFGLPYPIIRLFTPCPWLAKSILKANRRAGRLLHLNQDVADLIFLAVSQDNSCRYCYAAQRVQMRILGFDDERIRMLEEASFEAQGNPRERLVIDFARRISRANPTPAASDLAELREAGYEDGEILEIIYVAASTVGGNRITTIPAVPVARAEGMDFRGVKALLRPIIARRMRSRHRRGEPAFPPPELEKVPFAYVLSEFDGLPVGISARQDFLGAWSSDILTRRAKALVFAVVARGLGSERAENEAKGLLAAEGLDAGEVDQVLTHLGSPALDPIEALMVPFARETIRCRPDEIQPRARKIRESLSVEQFLELVGVVGLANSVCRISLVLSET